MSSWLVRCTSTHTHTCRYRLFRCVLLQTQFDLVVIITLSLQTYVPAHSSPRFFFFFFIWSLEASYLSGCDGTEMDQLGG